MTIKLAGEITALAEKSAKQFKPVAADVSSMITPLGSKETIVKTLESNVKAEMSRVNNEKLSGLSADKFEK